MKECVENPSIIFVTWAFSLTAMHAWDSKLTISLRQIKVTLSYQVIKIYGKTDKIRLDMIISH